MRAVIAGKEEVAQGTLFVTLDLLGEQVEFRPGQYFFVNLPHAGHDDERGLRRHFTVATSPTEHGVLGFATRMRDSAFKLTLRDLPVGAEVDAEPPKGSFVLPPPDRPLVFVAGGIGITPFRSMLRYIRDAALPHEVTLVYSNRDRASAAFLDELQALERELPAFRLLATMTQDRTWRGSTRRLDASFFRDAFPDGLQDQQFLVAGPPPMTEAMEDTLRAAGVSEERIAADRFSGY